MQVELRSKLEKILEESFKGFYLWHSKKMLREVDVVKAACWEENNPIGVVMLKVLNPIIGYVFYIAVSKDYRRRRIGTRLLDDSLKYFSSASMKEVYSTVREDNVESDALFRSRGFNPTSYRDVSRKYGKIQAINIYRNMVVLPGEKVYCKKMA